MFGLLQVAEQEADSTIAQQTAAVQLLNDVQTEEGSLSEVFYSLTARPARQTGLLPQRLQMLSAAIHQKTGLGTSLSNAADWQRVREKADQFVAEGRAMLQRPGSPAAKLARAHQEVIDAMADLTSSTFAASTLMRRREAERNAERVQHALLLLSGALGLAFAGAVLTVYFANRMFGQVRSQALELRLLSSRTMSDQEETARRFSRELHDHLGQTLSALEANLVAMQHAQKFDAGRIEDCFVVLKDAVEHVREFSQLLRPSILDDFGLNASLQWLGDKFSERTGIVFQFSSSFEGRLPGETETQLFRIAQEALTNVGRHSGATEVTMQIAAGDKLVRLRVVDNGKGLVPPMRKNGLGLAGMRARALAAGGTVSIQSSAGSGVSVVAEVPLQYSEAEADA